MNNIKESKLELDYGMLLRAKKRLRTSDRSFNQPGRTYCEENTVVCIVDHGGSRGDVTCKGIGKITEDGSFLPMPNLPNDFFREGHTTRCPYDKGIVDLECWELIGHLTNDCGFESYQRQAPHTTRQPLVIVKIGGEFQFEIGEWNGWKLQPKSK